MNELPCIDCITLAICKNEIKNISYGHFPSYYIRMLNLLDISRKCSLLKDYIGLDVLNDYLIIELLTNKKASNVLTFLLKGSKYE